MASPEMLRKHRTHNYYLLQQEPQMLFQYAGVYGRGTGTAIFMVWIYWVHFVLLYSTILFSHLSTRDDRIR